MEKQGIIVPKKPTYEELEQRVHKLEETESARKKAENELRESEEKFRSIAEISLAGVYIIQDGKFIYINKKFSEIFGYTVEELNNMPHQRTVHPEDREFVQAQINKRISGKVNYVNYTFRGIKKNKEIIHLEIYGASIQLDGKPAVSGSILDITARKKAEEQREKLKNNLEKIVSQRTKKLKKTMMELSESEKRFRETIEMLPEVVFETNMDFVLTYVNQKAYDLFQYTRENFNKGISVIDIVSEQDREKVFQDIRAVLSDRASSSPEYLVRKKDGDIFPAIISFMPMMKDNQCVGIRGVVIDITMQKKVQQMREAVIATHREMEIAKNIQTALIPSLDKFSDWKFDMSANMTPAEDVGGDYYDVIRSVDNKLWFGIGDVTGHGLVSGLVMMMAQVSLNTLIRSNPGLTPEEALICANRIIRSNIREGLKVDHHMTISLFLEEREGRYKYAGAHEIILIYRANSNTIEQIPTRGMWLGIIPDISKQTKKYSGEFVLEKDDILFLYTDGVIEICNEKKEQFDIKRLEEFLIVNAKHSANKIKENLLFELNQFMHQQLDDITFLIMKKK